MMQSCSRVNFFPVALAYALKGRFRGEFWLVVYYTVGKSD